MSFVCPLLYIIYNCIYPSSLSPIFLPFYYNFLPSIFGHLAFVHIISFQTPLFADKFIGTLMLSALPHSLLDTVLQCLVTLSAVIYCAYCMRFAVSPLVSTMLPALQSSDDIHIDEFYNNWLFTIKMLLGGSSLQFYGCFDDLV